MMTNPGIRHVMIRLLQRIILALLLCLPLTPAGANDMMTDVVIYPAVPQEEFPQPQASPDAVFEEGVESPEIPHYQPVSGKRERVVILHGIGRNSASMYKVARVFRHAGYRDDNIGYRSTQDTLALNIQHVYNRIRHFSDKQNEVTHFVCYSLGCLVTRGIIHKHRPKNLGRVVMLGPPNQGSEMAEFLRHHALANWFYGPNLPQLGTGNRQALQRLIGDSADYELGIIAGMQARDPVGAYVIPGADDGRVSVENTKLDGMKEHLVMDVNHTNLITDNAVLAQALYFIQHGQFDYGALQQ